MRAQWALLRRTTLGRLTSPIREPTVLEKWSPYEVALFESGICLTGKLFSALAALIKTKSVADCIEFYYVWKRSKNYAQWKASFKVPLAPGGRALRWPGSSPARRRLARRRV